MRERAVNPYVIGVGSLLLGLLAGWFLWHPVSKPETSAPEQPLNSGGIIVRREPEAPIPKPVKRAAKEAGGKLERSVSVTVQPEMGTVQPHVGSADANQGEPCTCNPVTVGLGLVRMPDRTRRVVATAQGGEILSAIDIPIDPAPYAKSLKWAAGATYDPLHREFGAFVDRDLGPFRLGLELQQRDGGLAAVVRAGVRF